MVKERHASITMTPSRIMNSISWFASFPAKPSLNSTDRKTVRINKHAVAPKSAVLVVSSLKWSQVEYKRLTEEEQLESLAVDKVGKLGVTKLRVLSDAPEELETAGRECKQAGNLDGETSDQNVCSHINLEVSDCQYVLSIVITPISAYHVLVSQRCRSSNASADGLDNKTDNVASQEEGGVGSRLDSTDGLPVDDNEPSKSQVDSSSDEDRTDSQSDEVPQEVVSAKGIPIQEHPRDVADRFSHQAEAHGDHEDPRLVPNAQVHLSNREDGHDSQEDGISGHSRPVPDIAPIFDGASVQGTDKPFDVAFGGRHFGQSLSRCAVLVGVVELVGMEMKSLLIARI